MCDEPITVVRRLYDGFERADIEAIVGAFDPSVEIFAPETLPWSNGNYTGKDGALEYFRGALSVLDGNRFDVQEFHTDGGWVAAVGKWSATVRATGDAFDVRFVHFWTVRDGKIVKAEGISDTAGIVRAFTERPAVTAGA
ncbi:nuclear transport factor 2 family protein [Streptomyces sp. NPDC053367]|uniref:nuclear transport factor 2 family protein n=1 Tax=Streptomyces sp. NPDC053367 TaxID=3365700 RepID=UPI0037D35E8A